MKILISATAGTLDSQVDERFGRAKCFVIVDSEKMEIVKVIDNENLAAEHGVGIKVATMVLKENPDAAITKHFGPKAFDVLREGRPKLYLLNGGTVRDVVNQFKNGELKEYLGD